LAGGESVHGGEGDGAKGVNGLSLGMIALKNIADVGATIDQAFDQLQTYQAQIPRLFHFNEVLVISDGAKRRSRRRGWSTSSRRSSIARRSPSSRRRRCEFVPKRSTTSAQVAQ
jgi:hypothetical protein